MHDVEEEFDGRVARRALQTLQWTHVISNALRAPEQELSPVAAATPPATRAGSGRPLTSA